jgi:hypothetical protein
VGCFGKSKAVFNECVRISETILVTEAQLGEEMTLHQWFHITGTAN